MKKQIGKSYIVFERDDMDASQLCIGMVYVHPEERGQHLGYRLLDLAKEHAAQNGFKSIGLYAYGQEEGGLEGDALVSYYENYGFESDADCAELMTMAI